MTKSMTVGEAALDPGTVLGAFAIRMAAEREERLAAAQKIADRDGITLEEALQRWVAVPS
jgi:hypothetical protein